MKLNKIKLKSFIIPYKKKCEINNLTPYQVSGINKDKEFFEPSNQVGSDTSNYKEVPPNYFACNLMHVGRDVVLPIAMNTTTKVKYVSPAYNIFKIESDEILADYFFIYLKSKEKDRYFWFHTDSSVRDGMSWDDFVDLEIAVPSIDIQKKYVSIYKSMLENQKAYERGLNDLKLVCEGYIENIRKNHKQEPIIDYLEERTEKNKNGEVSFMRGVGLNGFIEPNQVRTENSLKKCNIFYKGDFVYPPSSLKNGVISYNNDYDKAICTEEYIVFHIKDDKKLNPYYLLMWLKREQLGRYIDFASCDSVRNRFYFKDLNIIEIPIPDIETQNAVAKVYECYIDRKEINEILKSQIKDICPILIDGSIKESKED